MLWTLLFGAAFVFIWSGAWCANSYSAEVCTLYSQFTALVVVAPLWLIGLGGI